MYEHALLCPTNFMHNKCAIMDVEISGVRQEGHLNTYIDNIQGVSKKLVLKS